MAAKLLFLFIICCVSVDGKLKEDAEGKPIGADRFYDIRDSCSNSLRGLVYLDCTRQLVPEKRGGVYYVKLVRVDTTLTWQFLEAEEGGYYIRTCKGDHCGYWKDAGTGDYVTLSTEPITRWKFTKLGNVKKRYLRPTVWGPTFVNDYLTGTGYRIESLTDSAYKYVSYKTRSWPWLAMNKRGWIWIIDPEIQM